MRKKILNQNGIDCEVEPANIDEDQIKESLLKEKATPKIISKNLAELKANKISEKNPDKLVLGADSVIDLNGELISKPVDRKEAFEILKKIKRPKTPINKFCLHIKKWIYDMEFGGCFEFNNETT